MKPNPLPSLGDRAAVRQLLERIREHRLARNWSQADMARRTGMSRATYQNLEGGYGNPTLTNLTRVLGILGHSARIADLLPAPDPALTLESLQQATRQPARLRASPKRA